MYPQPPKGDVVDDYFGTRVADPYRWMEDLNSPEVKQWIAQENAITFKYLDGVPIRNQLRNRITELWNYPRLSAPFYEGRWFYTRNSGLERQSVWFVRTVSGAAARQRDRSSSPRQEDFLSRARHHAVGRPPDLRTAGRADPVHLSLSR